MFMQLDVAMGIPKAAMSLDWSKFFDSLGRDTGNELMQESMTDDSEGLLIVAAERIYSPSSRSADSKSAERSRKGRGEKQRVPAGTKLLDSSIITVHVRLDNGSRRRNQRQDGRVH